MGSTFVWRPRPAGPHPEPRDSSPHGREKRPSVGSRAAAAGVIQGPESRVLQTPVSKWWSPCCPPVCVVTAMTSSGEG